MNVKIQICLLTKGDNYKVGNNGRVAQPKELSPILQLTLGKTA